MTMGLVALEEIVMGSGTRRRLPCAGVNSPNHPPGTWSPDSRVGVVGVGGEVEPQAGPASATGCRDGGAPGPDGSTTAVMSPCFKLHPCW